MPDSASRATAPVLGVSACVLRDGKFLMVKRGKAPNRDLWSLPGGHVGFGEPLAQAAAREVMEETGVTARFDAAVDVIEVIRRDGDGAARTHYAVVVMGGRHVAGTPQAGDDAAEAAWLSRDEVATLPHTEGLLDVLTRALTRLTGV